MSAVRRSTRGSSVGKVNSPLPTATTPRRTAIWRRRHSKDGALPDSDDDNLEIRAQVLQSDDENNDENQDLLNKMESKANRVGTKGSKTSKHEPKTPRSSSSSSSSKHIRPMPACKKRELLSKRKSDESDDSDAAAKQTTEDIQNVSPPKQSRQQQKTLVPQHLISPTRLLDRLSIDERQEASKDDYDDKSKAANAQQESGAQKPPRNKYQNARRVLNSAETLHLPGREQQLQELREFFTEHLREERSGSLYVSGQPGTGKTACLSLLLRAPEFMQSFQRAYINCTSISSVGGVYKKLCAELKLRPNGRSEREHLTAIKEHLCTSSRMLLIVLDEIDQLCSARQSVLYTIFEWPALPGARLLLVGIANSLDLTERALMRLNVRCELKPQLMHFPPYNKQQIVEIFRARLEEAGVLDVFPPVTLQLLAAKVSSVSGDVRRALDIGRRVVEIAEQQKQQGRREVNLSTLNIEGCSASDTEETLKPVQVTQVAAVLNHVYGASQNLQEDIEESFPLQQKIMLCTLMLMLRNERHKDINIGRLYEVYRRICSKRNIHALDQAEFAGLVDLVETRGILRIMRKKEPRLSKVQLQWDEDEVHGALRDKQLIASILDDTACLSGRS